jgi:hypothetical protein
MLQISSTCIIGWSLMLKIFFLGTYPWPKAQYCHPRVLGGTNVIFTPLLDGSLLDQQVSLL